MTNTHQDNVLAAVQTVCAALDAGRLTYGDLFGAVDNALFNGEAGEECDDVLEDALDHLVNNGTVDYRDADDGPFRRYFKRS